MPRRTQKQQPSTAVVSTQPKFTKEKLRKFLLGSKEKEGFYLLYMHSSYVSDLYIFILFFIW